MFRTIPINKKKKPKRLPPKVHSKKETLPKPNPREVEKLKKQKMPKKSIQFLIDENVLGIDRYLESMGIQFKKVGDSGCPKLGSDDPTVAKFAKENNFVVVTNDDKLQKQCKVMDIDCVILDMGDLAKKVKTYADSHQNLLFKS